MRGIDRSRSNGSVSNFELFSIIPAIKFILSQVSVKLVRHTKHHSGISYRLKVLFDAYRLEPEVSLDDRLVQRVGDFRWHRRVFGGC